MQGCVAFSFLLLAFLFCLTFSVSVSASAGIKQCERLTPEQQMQADFCEARVACRVAIDLLATCADVTAALRTFHDTLSAPDPGRPEPAEADAQGERPRAQPTRAHHADGKLRKPDEIRLIEAEDRALATAMRDAHCSQVEMADLVQCERLEKKALELQRRLDQFKRDSASVRAAGEAPVMMPVLQSLTPKHGDDTRAITYVNTDGASADTPKTNDAASTMLPALAAGPARAPGVVDALFKEAITSADAEANERAQREANKRAAAAATEAAAAENTALADAPRTAQQQADAQSMLTGRVGEVFALADRLESEKQFDTAREAFRTLIARFPDHALAGAAAARLSAASTTSATLSGNPARQDSAQGAESPDACDAQVAKFDAELARLKERKPANASSVTMLQTVMYVASKSLSLGQGVCSGNRREDELTNGMQATFDDARRACANLKANAGECVARAPTW
ncbi:MAG: hypothetical protein H7335_12440 [Massilia sp.]|nr:hypothetical protein [Massilia sp.]